MERGTVKWFDADKGYGFIARPDAADLFVHVSSVEGLIEDGDEVEFRMGTSERGAEARDVRIIGRLVDVAALQAADLVFDEAGVLDPGLAFDVRPQGGERILLPPDVAAVVAPDGRLISPVQELSGRALTGWLITLGGEIAE